MKDAELKDISIESEIIKLLREYFENRKQIKKAKKQRIEFRETNECEDGECLYDGTLVENYCNVCKQRHEYHKQILKLNYRNNGILNSLRTKVSCQRNDKGERKDKNGFS